MSARRKIVIFLKVFFSTIVVAGFSFWFVVFHLKTIPLLDVSEIQELAKDFDPVKKSVNGKTTCKTVTDISWLASPDFIKPYYYWDFEFQQAIMLFALKMHRCQIDLPGAETWDGYIGHPESRGEMSHPVAIAFDKIAYSIMESYGGALEYPVAAYCMNWSQENIGRIHRTEVLDEIAKICKIINVKFKDSNNLEFCKERFPRAQ